MPFSKPKNIFPVLNLRVTPQQLEGSLSPEQVQIITRVDGSTSIRSLAMLLNLPLDDLIVAIQSLVELDVLEIHERKPSKTTFAHQLPSVDEESVPQTSESLPSVVTGSVGFSSERVPPSAFSDELEQEVGSYSSVEWIGEGVSSDDFGGSDSTAVSMDGITFASPGLENDGSILTPTATYEVLESQEVSCGPEVVTYSTYSIASMDFVPEPEPLSVEVDHVPIFQGKVEASSRFDPIPLDTDKNSTDFSLESKLSSASAASFGASGSLHDVARTLDEIPSLEKMQGEMSATEDEDLPFSSTSSRKKHPCLSHAVVSSPTLSVAYRSEDDLPFVDDTTQSTVPTVSSLEALDSMSHSTTQLSVPSISSLEMLVASHSGSQLSMPSMSSNSLQYPRSSGNPLVTRASVPSVSSFGQADSSEPNPLATRMSVPSVSSLGQVDSSAPNPLVTQLSAPSVSLLGRVDSREPNPLATRMSVPSVSSLKETESKVTSSPVDIEIDISMSPPPVDEAPMTPPKPLSESDLMPQPPSVRATPSLGEAVQKVAFLLSLGPNQDLKNKKARLTMEVAQAPSSLSSDELDTLIGEGTSSSDFLTALSPHNNKQPIIRKSSPSGRYQSMSSSEFET